MLTCGACGNENIDGAKFCNQCATPLVESPRRGFEERKVVTVLFCDLVGFTSRSESADPEDVLATVRPYYSRLRSEIEGFGGTVEKFIGDAVMAVFGAPVVHEDDAERAVRAGLRILESIDGLNQGDRGLDLSVRIGINTGETMVSMGARVDEGEGIVTGDVVNTAARLQTAAPPNALVVGETTWRATRPIFEFERLEPVAVKGEARPVRLWQVTGALASFGVDLTRTHAAPLVGRDLELRLLDDLLARTVRERSVALVTLVGEPGLGKTRLSMELMASAARDGVKAYRGRCLPYGDGITFWALGEIVKSWAGILETDDADLAREKLASVVPEDEVDRNWILERAAALLGLDINASSSREESFEAWRRLVETIARTGPVVLTIEDLHWADEALLSFLEYVTDRASQVPLMLLCTCRPELFEKAKGWGGGTGNASTVNLGPLSAEEIDRVFTFALLGDLQGDQRATLLTRAGGNPLYAEEFARLLSEQGADSAFRAEEDAAVPGPIQALIAARLDALPAREKAILLDSSVIGETFWSGGVATIGKREPSEVLESMRELGRRELVRRMRTSTVEGEEEYTFWHALVHDVAYARLPRSERATRHRAAAEWIRARAAGRAEDAAEIVAFHLTTALDLSRAAHAGPGEIEALETDALAALLLAGSRALPLDVDRATDLFARALELCPPGHARRADGLTSYGDACRLKGDFPAAVEALDEAAALYARAGDLQGEGRASIRRAQTAVVMLAWEEMNALTARAVDLLEAGPPSPDLLAAYRERAGHLGTMLRPREALDFVARAMDVSSTLGLPPDVGVVGYRGSARLLLGDHRGGLEDLREAFDQARAAHRTEEAMWCGNNLGVVLLQIEGADASNAQLESTLALAESAGHHAIGEVIEGTNLEPLFHLGRWNELLTRAGALITHLQAFASLEARSWVLAVRSLQGAMSDQRDEVVDLLRLVTAETAEAFPDVVVIVNTAVALQLAARGDRAGAERSLRAIADPAFANSSAMPGRAPWLVRLALSIDEPELAAELATISVGTAPLYDLVRATATAELAAYAGRTDEAAAAFRDLEDRWDTFGSVFESAHAAAGLAFALAVLAPHETAEAAKRAAERFDAFWDDTGEPTARGANSGERMKQRAGVLH